jgi:hypothetical protein
VADALVIKNVHIKKEKKSDGIMIFFNLAPYSILKIFSIIGNSEELVNW